MTKPSENKQIGSILDHLIHAERFARETSPGAVQRGPILTTLGVPLMEEEDGRFVIDLTGAKVFAGIPGFVSYLAKQALEHCRKTTTDVLTQVVVDADTTPELATLGVGHVVLYARAGVARFLVEEQQEFLEHLRVVFDSLQTPQWGGLVFPAAFRASERETDDEEEGERLALHFPFPDQKGQPNRHFFLLEFDPGARFLRITVEDAAESRLFLKRIPHRTVKDTGRFHYKHDIAAMVEQIFTGIHRECQNHQTEYTEVPGRQPALFELLISAGLIDITGAVFRWTQETAEMLLLRDSPAFSTVLAKILLLLQDGIVIRSLSQGNVLEMVDGPNRVFFDLSRKGAMLNVSIGERRKQPDMKVHLERMPTLHGTVRDGVIPSLGDYLDSMRFASLYFFFREAFRALEEGRKLLPIEDGAYLAPMLTRYCHEGLSLEEVLELCQVEAPADIPSDGLFSDWLREGAPATFEHTMNGYYGLREAESEHGGLQLPAFTIALSKYKNTIEAESCAYAIVGAVESIFHGLGRCIMHRNALVLGSAGNIGKFLLKAVADRVSYGGAWGIDLRAAESTSGLSEWVGIRDVPREVWQELDLFLGMTGVSVLKESFFEELLVHGTARELFFASGSTKTVEFADLSDWLGRLTRSEAPGIGGRPVSLETSPIKDPQNGFLQGHRVRIAFSDPEGVSGITPDRLYKDLLLLGDGMPINFLFYGVPGEVIDGVFDELFCLVGGAVGAFDAGEVYPPGIYSLDVNVDRFAARRDV